MWRGATGRVCGGRNAASLLGFKIAGDPELAGSARSGAAQSAAAIRPIAIVLPIADPSARQGSRIIALRRGEGKTKGELLPASPSRRGRGCRAPAAIFRMVLADRQCDGRA